jgi:septal ring factor EnvC (AmiA/AmiB activator)
MSGSKTSALFLVPPSVVKDEEWSPGSLERKKQTPYSCAKCGTRFPVRFGKRRYAIVPLGELKYHSTRLNRFKNDQARLNGKIASLAEEREKMKSQLKSAKEEADIKQLESKLSSLESHVTHLKRDKEDLEQRMTELAARQ